MSELDVVLRGGTVVDGSGGDPFVADVGIGAGLIRAVSADRLSARRVIDASGQVVTPGFVDLHSHADFTLPGWPAATTQICQGVTTLLVGNCGWSPFPVGDLAELRSATAFFDPDLDWAWSDVDGFATAADAVRPAVNVALQVGHSSLRLAAMGGADRAADAGDLDRMAGWLGGTAARLLHGFSTGLIYAPGTYSDEAEVRHLVKAAAASGLLYSTHIRDESAGLLDAIGEAVDAAAAAGARLEISHLKSIGPVDHGGVPAALELIDEAVARGVDVAADVYPYTASSTTLTSRLPGWAMDGGPGELLRRLADPAGRERIAAELRAQTGILLDPAGVVIAELGPGRYADAAGASIADIARRDGVDAAEAVLRVLEAHDAAVAVVNHGMREDDVIAALRHPRVSVASDGWVLKPSGAGRPHPRSFGTFPRVLARYVRDLGVLSLPEAVRKMTAWPAARLGLTDRGTIAPGKVADVVVLDAERVADTSTFDQPWRLPTGISTVLVGGQPALDGGEPTDVRAGRVLRR
ncbi:N-acyl-D-amino-acid deacylase family protein [Jiangella gansuensis]|uniref:N-acyl-D-amino-acid deacylase family protein n=1 Tax=Jiangella gansuensis TaxID=281473 RepID=UPI00047B3740|nr:amidohydrolase family protein [Jiangella gansuensis]